MRNVIIILFVSLSILVSGCSSNDRKTEETRKETTEETPSETREEQKGTAEPGFKSSGVAADICDCLGDIDRGLSQKAKNIFTRSMESKDPESTVEKELEKLSAGEKTRVSREIQEFSARIEGEDSPFNACMEKMDKKYPNFGDDEKQATEVVKAMDKEKDCAFVAGMLRAFLNEANQ